MSKRDVMNKYSDEFMKGVEYVCQMLRDDERTENDKYGIGNMCSQWTASEVADDLLQRVMSENK